MRSRPPSEFDNVVSVDTALKMILPEFSSDRNYEPFCIRDLMDAKWDEISSMTAIKTPHHNNRVSMLSYRLNTMVKEGNRLIRLSKEDAKKYSKGKDRTVYYIYTNKLS